ncbi:nitric oxide reductase transcriptional regulator NorR [Terasakiispira papahanaumokuakeensis]|nr:nitric oxide reductase transcriptional regulator NorR [Terasakiispira papahanaumokuakeensis]
MHSLALDWAGVMTSANGESRYQYWLDQLTHYFPTSALGLLKLEGAYLCPVAIHGLVDDTRGRRFELTSQPRLQRIISQREWVRFAPDCTWCDPYDGLLKDHQETALPVHDCIGVSLYVGEQCWGALTLDSVASAVLTDEQLQLIDPVARLTEWVIYMSTLEAQVTDYDPANAAFVYEPILKNETGMIGHSPVMQSLQQDIEIVADSPLPVLIQGETGVGKELVAQQLHQRSGRASQPLVYVNCAALPESLVESELFGHVKGAFSGAVSDRKGKFESADQGTLLLDEVGELPLVVQAKLLRCLQNGEIQRLGSDTPRRVDVRIVAATNRHLSDMVRWGEFRADLYHRLSVYPVQVPPLRDRGGDILMLAGYFVELNRARLGVRGLRLTPQAQQALCVYHWPGNVRELEHVLSRAALRAVNQTAKPQEVVSIESSHLDLDVLPTASLSAQSTRHCDEMVRPQTVSAIETLRYGVSLKDAVAQLQIQLIEQALEAHEMNWTQAAHSLQMDASNLHKLARRLGLKSR